MASALVLLALLATIKMVTADLESKEAPTMVSLAPSMTMVEACAIRSKLETGSWTAADAQNLCAQGQFLCDKDFVFVNPTRNYNWAWVSPHKANMNGELMSINSYFRLASVQTGQSVELGSQQNSFPSNAFIHPQLLPALPFQMGKMSKVLSALNIPSESALALGMANTLEVCQEMSRDQTAGCILSLDGMASFVEWKLGDKAPVMRIATEWETQTAIVVERTTLATNVVTCHPFTFPYRVYLCHLVPNTIMVKVVMQAHGNTFDGTATCHMETSSFDPNHKAFSVLNMKPGDGEVCHWLAFDDIAFGV